MIVFSELKKGDVLVHNSGSIKGVVTALVNFNADVYLKNDKGETICITPRYFSFWTKRTEEELKEERESRFVILVDDDGYKWFYAQDRDGSVWRWEHYSKWRTRETRKDWVPVPWVGY